MAQSGTRDTHPPNVQNDMPDSVVGLAVESRQERQLMRQRGAGNRAINNVDFGFAFGTPSTVAPTPSRPRTRTRSRTPTTALPAGLRTPTVIVADHITSVATASPRGIIDPSLLTRNDRPSASPSSVRSHYSVRLPSTLAVPFARPSPAKRRRLDDFSDQVVSAPSPAHLAPTIAEELEVEESIVALLRSSSEAHNRNITFHHEAEDYRAPQNVPSSPLFVTRDPETETPVATNYSNKENEGLPTSGVSKKPVKRSKRRSIGQQSLFKRKRKSSSLQPLPTPSDTQDSIEAPSALSVAAPRQTLESTRRRSLASSHANPGISAASRAQGQDETPQPEPLRRSVSNESMTPANISQSQPRKRKKRKSVVLGPKRRRSAIPSTGPNSSPVVETIEVDEVTAIEAAQDPEFFLNELTLDAPLDHTLVDEDDEIPETSQILPSVDPDLPNINHKQQISREVVDDDDDETYLPNEQSPGPNPAPKRKAKQSKSRPRTSASRASPNTDPPSRLHSGYPITMHRMTNARALPTITEEAEDSEPESRSEDELTSLTPSFTTRKQPNAVDVLAQLCREQIEDTINAIQSSNLPKIQVNKRLAALVAFQETLQDRLFEVSQGLDYRMTLEARVRKARREKATLQNEWLELRRQRDVLELKKDAIRRKHWENEILSRTRFEASQAAFAAERAQDTQGDVLDNGLELRLREVGGIASSRDNGGVLEQIRSFNARLERIAMGLG